MLTMILHAVLMVVAMLVFVPGFTADRVKVRGGFLAGLCALVVIGFVNAGLWVGLTLITVGGTLIGNIITLGLVGLLINGLAILFTSKLMPRTLFVRDYMSAFWAALVMALASCAFTLML